MRAEFRIDPAADAPYAVIYAPSRTAEVDQILHRLTEPHVLHAYGERGEALIEADEIIRIYTENRRVLLECEAGIYQLRCRLYELEDKLDPAEFIRISNSEIVGRRWIRDLDFSLTGTIRLTMKNGGCCYVSRRYVSRIRRAFEE